MNKQKPKTLTVCEYYLSEKRRRKIKNTLKSIPRKVARVLRAIPHAIAATTAELLRPFAELLAYAIELLLDTYRNVNGQWYCVHCGRWHSRRTVKYHIKYNDGYDFESDVCSLGYDLVKSTAEKNKEEQDYQDCIDAATKLDRELGRFKRLYQVLNNATGGNNNESNKD